MQHAEDAILWLCWDCGISTLTGGHRRGCTSVAKISHSLQNLHRRELWKHWGR
jgi:hypothetical protein